MNQYSQLPSLSFSSKKTVGPAAPLLPFFFPIFRGGDGDPRRHSESHGLPTWCSAHTRRRTRGREPHLGVLSPSLSPSFFLFLSRSRASAAVYTTQGGGRLEVVRRHETEPTASSPGACVLSCPPLACPRATLRWANPVRKVPTQLQTYFAAARSLSIGASARQGERGRRKRKKGRTSRPTKRKRNKNKKVNCAFINVSVAESSAALHGSFFFVCFAPHQSRRLSSSASPPWFFFLFFRFCSAAVVFVCTCLFDLRGGACV